MKRVVFKMKRTILIFVLLLFFLTLLEALAFDNTVKISSPRNGDDVGARIIVKGISKITDKSHIWVLIHAKLLQDQWWPQPRPVVDDKGNWQALCYIGERVDIGLDFEIAAAAFSKEGEAKILGYHEYGKKTGQWLPISFPQTTSAIDIVTVKKVSH